MTLNFKNRLLLTLATATLSLYAANSATADSTPDQAIDLGDLGTATRSGQIGEFVVFGSGDKFDYYRFTSRGSGEAKATLEYSVGLFETGTQPSIVVLDSNENSVTTSENKTTSSAGFVTNVSITYTWNVAAGSTYFVGVTAPTGFGATQWNYDLEIEAPQPDDAVIEGAIDLGELGSAQHDDKIGGFAFIGSDGIDYFKFRPRLGGEINVSVSYKTSVQLLLSAPSATIRNSSDEAIDSMSSVDSTKNIFTGVTTVTKSYTFDGVAGVPYFIRVTSGTGIGTSSFNYRLSVITPKVDDDFEFNNSFAKAFDLGTLTGTNYLPDLTLNTDADHDFFKFRSRLKGPASIRLSYPRGLVIGEAPPAPAFALLDKNQNSLSVTPFPVNPFNLFTGTKGGTFTVMPGVDYFIHVELNKASDRVHRYAMTVAVPELVEPDIVIKRVGSKMDVSYDDPHDAFNMESSTTLQAWANVATSSSGDTKSVQYNLPAARYFRLKEKTPGSGGGVIIPRVPDIVGGIPVVDIIPIPDPGPIINPGSGLIPVLPPIVDPLNP